MQSLKIRLLSLMAVSLLSLAAIVVFTIGVYEYHQVESQTIAKNTQNIVMNVYETQVHFKRQVQEWKNVLLRGHNKTDYDKYLSKFYKEEKLAQNHIKEAMIFQDKTGRLYQLSAQFLSAHVDLAEKYKEGLNAFNTAVLNPYFSADKTVRGIDRKPSELLDKLVKEVNAFGDRKLIETNDEFLKARNHALIITAIAAVILYLFLYFALTKLIFKPINEFTKHVSSLAQGQSDLEQRLTFSGKSELSQIAKHFNTFLDKLEITFLKINTTSGKLMQASTKSAHITESTNQSIRKQSADIVELNSSMNAMSDSIDNVVILSNKATSAANEVKNAANNGQAEVTEVDAMITQLSTNVDKTATALTDLNQEIDAISNISDLITSIAEQTSLLSLNAAIEAARAGESGRGFAVVADEVRNLAKQTNDATDQIHATVQRIQKKSEDSIDMIKEGTKTAQKCKMQGDRVNVALTNITDSVANILCVNEEITVAASTQENLTADVRDSIKEIEIDLTQTAEGAQKNTSDSSDLAQLALVLQTLIREFKISSNEVEEHTIDVELF